MSAHRWWVMAAALFAVVIAAQVGIAMRHSPQYIARADVPTVAPGADVLAGVIEIPLRVRANDYRRAAFGDSWTADTSAPGGHNGCDTRFLGGSGVLGEALQEAGFKQGTLR